MNIPAIKEALSYEDYFNQDARLRREYELREMAERDRRSEIELSIQEGIQNIVINGLKKGHSVDVIADITGFSEKEIEEIRVKYKL